MISSYWKISVFVRPYENKSGIFRQTFWQVLSEHYLGIVPLRCKYQVYLARRLCAGESLGLSHRRGNQASEASRSVNSDCHPKRKLDNLSSVYPSLPTV